MLRDQLARQAIGVGRRHVRTLMLRTGHMIYPYLLRDLAITRSNKVWALDTTYNIPMARGCVYLTAMVDVAGRRVLAHKVATTLEACQPKKAA